MWESPSIKVIPGTFKFANMRRKRHDREEKRPFQQIVKYMITHAQSLHQGLTVFGYPSGMTTNSGVC